MGSDGGQLEQTERRWPDLEQGPWRLVMLWASVDGRPECVGLEVKPVDPPSGESWSERHVLPTSALREVRLGEMIATDRAAMTPQGQRPTNLRQSTMERLEETATVYQQARAAGLPPVKAVAGHFHLSQGGASNLVARARAAGFLPPTSAGVPMG